ncbi:hypothetical protein ACRAWB_01830 [Leifsonia poae]|uniref:hypothetical protein n=1 Tax=Leifsonia poae TaxID=110933 RepID=UPI003D69DD2D
MNINKATGTHTTDNRADTEALKAAYATAKATPCDFPGCDGGWHEPGVLASQWAHHADADFDNGEVQVSLTRDGLNTPHAQVWLEGTYDDLTADDLRRLATVYEALPALFREQAARLDRITREVESH